MKKLVSLFNMENARVTAVPEHWGGRNRAYVLEVAGERYILRVSLLGDRTEEDYLAETEYVHYLAVNGASVADVLPSVNGRLVECAETEDGNAYVSLFRYAPGMLISDNGYRYRKGAPLAEYFYNTGRTLGKLHALAKLYRPVHRRGEYFDKYNMAYIGELIPDTFRELKAAIGARLETFRALPQDTEDYGLVHFDFSDGNYHIDMETGKLTVFDFDNAMYCWYMFDLANLWTHGVGWCMAEPDAKKRRDFMEGYFETVLAGYRSETTLPKKMEEKLTLFIDMVLIENIVDEFECCRRAGEEVDPEDIEDAADALIRRVPWAGFLE